MSVRVFLAEDNDDLAHLVRRSLEARAWSVTRARTATEAEARLRGDRFDAVILDYRLPDGDGLRLLTVLRESAPTTPVLFLTAHGSESVALQALGLGATDYMQKSGTMLEELPLRVAAMMEHGSDLRSAATVVSVPVREERPANDADQVGLSRESALEIVKSAVHGDIIGAALFDGAGEPIAALLPASIDPLTLGLALVQVHAQAVLMGRTTRLVPRSYAFLLETAEGTLAATAVPNKAIVAVLVKPGTRRAADKLDDLAARLR